jgi:hypothetical protein
MEAYREARSQQPAVAYYRLVPGAPSVAQFRGRADAAIERGFEFSSHPAFRLRAPLDWATDPYHDRSWRFWLNAWQPLDDVVAAYAATGDASYLHFAQKVACDWLRQNPLGIRSNPFAWYDMAAGLRALQLAYLVDASVRDPSTSAETVARLLAGAWEHGWYLLQDRNFNSLTNHGIYQAAGLLALGRSLPELRDADRWKKRGEVRLRMMFEKSFSAEGVHLEHSPGYQLHMTRLLAAITDSGLTDDPALSGLRRRAEESLAWMIAPDGTLPTVGDTDPTVLSPSLVGMPDSAVAPVLAYAVTRGAQGSPPARSFKVFPRAGYGVFRSGWPKASWGWGWSTPPSQASPSLRPSWGQASFLMFTGAFHSRTHKHADDLSFVWYDAGRWLLIDAGRYGYYYDDPARLYCESTRAHNAVEIDGTDYSRRTADIFGSALTEWGQTPGAYFIAGEVRRRWPALIRKRALVFRPGQWVVVIDELDGISSHTYTQWLHFAPDLAWTAKEAAASAALGDGRSLHVLPLVADPPVVAEVVRGQREPRLQGWYSPRHRVLAPNRTLGLTSTGSGAVIATLLYLGEGRPTVKPGASSVHPDRISLTWERERKGEGFVLDRSGARTVLRLTRGGPS